MDDNISELISQVLFLNGEEIGAAGGKVLDNEQLSYLGRLGTQGLDTLNGEVARLNEELAIVDHQTRDMASQNYQIFVQSAQTANHIKKSLVEGTDLAVKLIDNTFPSLKTQLDTFSKNPCNNFNSKEKNAISLFENEGKLSKIIEMPWIIRRCLVEEKLHDAIKGLQMAQEMQKSISPQSKILINTCKEVMELQTEIQNALLFKLSSGNIGLSECLQTVSLLRSFFPDDLSLRFRFLQSRMKEVPFDQARTWIFDSLTQHRAAFGGDSNHFLSTWAAIQMNRVLSDLQKHLEGGESVDLLMMQAFYFGESLARVGADIRGLLIPIFNDYISRKLSFELTKAENKFIKKLHQFNLSTAPSFSSPDRDSANLDMPSPEDLYPPKQIMAHTPLALYLNDVLNVLNIIGNFPVIQCMPIIVQKLNGSISKVGSEIENWGKNEWLTWEGKEQNEFNRLKRYFQHLLVPHLDKIIRLIFPTTNISSMTGIGVTQCSELLQIKYLVN